MEKTYTMSEVADALGVHRQRVHQLIKELDLNPQRVDNRFLPAKFYYLFSQDELDAMRNRANKQVRIARK